MIGAAVHDPNRRFAVINYRTAKGSFDHLVGGCPARRNLKFHGTEASRVCLFSIWLWVNHCGKLEYGPARAVLQETVGVFRGIRMTSQPLRPLSSALFLAFA